MEVNEQVRLDWENVSHAIAQQAHFLTGEIPRMLAEWEELLGNKEQPRKIYMTGCGDSYFCGLAAQYAYWEWTGIPTEASEALDFSRYQARHVADPRQTWVVAVSNSGRVSRTIESLMTARRHGMRAIAVTYQPESALALEADTVYAYRYEDPGFGPGTISYTASLVSELTLALALGRQSGRLSAADVHNLVERMAQLGAGIPRVITEAVRVSEQMIAEHPVPWPYLAVVGAGPNYATALFGMAKMIESAHHSTVAQQTEEWAHEQYFCTSPGTLTVLLAAPGASRDRALEQAAAIRDVGGTSLILGAQDDREAQAAGTYFVGLPTTSPDEEMLTPLIYGVPLQVLSMLYAKRAGATMLGFDDPVRMQVNFRQIFGSQLQKE